jgi:hypothetical protein
MLVEVLLGGVPGLVLVGVGATQVLHLFGLGLGGPICVDALPTEDLPAPRVLLACDPFPVLVLMPTQEQVAGVGKMAVLIGAVARDGRRGVERSVANAEGKSPPTPVRLLSPWCSRSGG